MRQHAIPQNILDIEFKLFTKFTVREFVYMAIGVGFGGIFLYFFSKGSIPGIIAIPIFLFSSGMGLVLGLVDINDQKADVFLRNYIWAITHPTQRVWKNQMIDQKLGQIKPEFNVTQGSTTKVENEEQETAIIGGNTDAPKTQFIEQNKIDEFDRAEKEELARISQAAQATTGIPVQQEIARPQTPINNAPAPVQEVVQQTPIPTPTENVTPTSTPTSTPTPVQPVIAQPQNIRVDGNNIAQYAIELSNQSMLTGNLNFKLFDNQTQPIPQAVIVIKDDQGRIVSALQSDANGEIYSNKQFPPSTYTVQIQKSGYTFPTTQIVLDSAAIKPIKLTAN